MNVMKIRELFQKQSFFRDDFNSATDELLYYDIEKEIIYAYKVKEDGEWNKVFAMTDCTKRWIELIHMSHGYAIERVLRKLKQGESYVDIKCRFEKNGQYYWYFIMLQAISAELDNFGREKKIALGLRRNLKVINDGYVSEFSSVLDSRTRLYTKSAWEKMVEDNLWKYKKQEGMLCIMDINGFHDINEKYGYRIADELLIDLVKCIKKEMPASAVIGRLGADVIGIYMNDITGEIDWSRRIASVMFELKQVYARDVLYNILSLCAGAACYPKDGNKLSDLLEKAKEAWTFGKLAKTEELELYQEGMLRNTWKKDFSEIKEGALDEEIVKNMLAESPVLAMTRDLFADAGDYNASVKILVKRMCERYQVSTVRIYEYLEGNRTVCCTYEWLRGDYGKRFMEILPISEDNVSDKLNHIKKLGTVQSYENFRFETKREQRLPNVKSGQMVELLFKGNYVGRLQLLDYGQVHHWSKQDIVELTWFGELLSMLLYCGVRERLVEKDWKSKRTLDGLTGLYLPEVFKDKMWEHLEHNQRKKYVLVYSDISNFKYVNATFGYDVGDSILHSWADIIKKDIPHVLFSCRDSVDHFISFCEMDKALSEKEVISQINEAKSMIEQRIKNMYKGSNFALNTGAYCLLEGDLDLSAAIARANMARKKARSGSTGCELYTDSMRQAANEATAMVAGLDEALENKEFLVYLQPKVACESQKIVGAEALVRWIRQGKQIVYPDKFINTFERYGCIVKVDYCVYEQVFRLIRRWIDEGTPIIPISLNVSRAHFRNTELIQKIDALLSIYKIPTRAVEFEITESLYNEDLPGIDPVLEYFRKKGFKVSMDDFGADGSSLNALSTIPVDMIKMDKVFMKREGLKHMDKVVIKNVIHMANELEKEILCEGVETDEQREFITEVGCNVWQGYLKSKPLPVEEFEELLGCSEVEALCV